MKATARLDVGLFDVVERGRILASAYPAVPGRTSPLHQPGLAGMAAKAAGLEAAGFAGAYTIEGPHDIFFPLVLAAQATGLELSTAVAIAFPRSPMHVAHQAYDLTLLSEGRFSLGLGTQVKQVNERYYSTPWVQPVERMRDFLLALKAIFRCWQDGVPLRHEGPFYRVNFMNPPFNPGPNPFGVPPILLGALGPRMTQMAAEVTDGLQIHPFCTERYMRERMLPAVDAGLAASGRNRGNFEIVPMAMIASGRDAAEQSLADAGAAGIISFYGSTPTYRHLLELEGLGDLHVELLALSKQGRWADMAALIDVDIISRFAVRGEPAAIGPAAVRRYGDLAGRVNTYFPYAASLDLLAAVAGSFVRTESTKE